MFSFRTRDILRFFIIRGNNIYSRPFFAIKFQNGRRQAEKIFNFIRLNVNEFAFWCTRIQSIWNGAE